MDTGDPRQSAFNATRVRDAIKFAMKMGAANPVENRGTFRWNAVKSFDVADGTNNPYAWDKVPLSEITYSDVQVDMAIEFVTRSTLSGNTPIAEFDTPRAVLTILDVDWEDVVSPGATPRPMPDMVLLGDDVYNIDFIAPDIGLFNVNIYQVHCSAVDASS